MKRNKKGFTLIELLAVIVILAIIALIAVPTIMGIINKANKSAFKDTAYGIISAGELYFAEQQLELNGMSEAKKFNLTTDVNVEGGLQLKGEVPPEGTLVVNTQGQITLAISNGRYCITKGYFDQDITVTEDYETCDLPEMKLSDLATTSEVLGITEVASCTTAGQKCPDLTPFAIQVNEEETYKFYVLEDDGNKVTLIMSENIDEKSRWGSSSQGPTFALSSLKSATTGWTNITEYSYTLENDADPVGTNHENFYPNMLIENVRARLPKYSDLQKFEDSNYILPQEFGMTSGTTGSYWLSTAWTSDASRAMYVTAYRGKNAIAVHDLNYNYNCIRPVITISK